MAVARDRSEAPAQADSTPAPVELHRQPVRGDPDLAFEVLGELRVRRRGSRVRVPGRRGQALLAALLLHANRPVSVERLFQALWGEDEPATARTALQVHIRELRRLLEPGRIDGDGYRVIEHHAGGYRVSVEPRQLDLARAEQLAGEARRTQDAHQAAQLLRDAMELVRQDPLPDLAGEAFFRDELGRVEQLRLEVIGDWAEVELDVGVDSELVARLEELVRAHPFDERLRGHLMVALYRSGRQAEALATFNAGRTVLRDQLGLEPGPALRALERAVLNQDTTLAPQRRRSALLRLPADETPLIGRERAVVDVVERICDPGVRLVTLIGPGGVGKTRLAIAAARRAWPVFRDGVLLVELATVRSAELVPSAIGARLGLSDHGGRSTEEAVAIALAGREQLLLLDNLEQLGQATAEYVAGLLAACPSLTVLATSRVALNVAAEQRVKVEPLPLPGADDQLDANPSVQLFCVRAAAVRPAFELTDENRCHVAELCVRLEGVPLALELAAARCRVLAPGVLLERLSPTLDMLVAGPVDRPDRHRSLRAALDWSYELLEQRHAELLRRLSVFVGGFTLEAAESVGEGDVLSGLSALVDASLLTAEQTTLGDRFVVLETVREYGLERLEEAGETEDARRRHTEWAVAFAARAEPPLRGHPDTPVWLGLLDDEHENLRLARSWFDESGEPEEELRLASRTAATRPARSGHSETSP